ncbi:DUF6265 family protein [Algoriphagus boritolerans]|uniref:DUF6265 domain-containing protein n=1 Tax=Algoriphagus boritolerans DSM 17298 = JCM 18970 TaxID=1120964 RepID=A0A1H5S368_9BACT|nr:DUF6265 family protein [Algoriphagus boritolerans]SEF44328.1 hypothetical protein SAMN03080598_00233 [Algoriphagus boritolerans DSM 17298 = JCM 18970]
MKVLLISILLLTFSHLATAQVRHLEADQAPIQGKVEELNWMVGYWTGPGLGGECEEVWMPAVDGHMVGTFRFWMEGKLVFSEFMNLIQDGESVSMKLKHFNPDLTGWEEKAEWTTFRLIELDENKVWFDGLTIERMGDELIYHLSLTGNGQRTIEEFRFKRKAL